MCRPARNPFRHRPDYAGKVSEWIGRSPALDIAVSDDAMIFLSEYAATPITIASPRREASYVRGHECRPGARMSAVYSAATAAG
jgi:hypothetical protein